jgi:hypothetical protein
MLKHSDTKLVQTSARQVPARSSAEKDREIQVSSAEGFATHARPFVGVFQMPISSSLSTFGYDFPQAKLSLIREDIGQSGVQRRWPPENEKLETTEPFMFTYEK